MGAVWPFVTGFVALGHYEYQRPWAAYPLVDALARLTFDFARGRHAELLSGAFYRPLDTAVPHQFFATSMLVSPIVSGMLGWKPDAPHGKARLAPQLPAHWDRVVLKRLPVGRTTIDVTIEQRPGRIAMRPSISGPTVALEFDPPLPPGATSRTRTATEVTWSGGLSVTPPLARREPGEASAGLRVIDLAWNGVDGWIDVEGLAGHVYALELAGTLPAVVEGGSIVRAGDGRGTLSISMPADNTKWVRARIAMRSSRVQTSPPISR